MTTQGDPQVGGVGVVTLLGKEQTLKKILQLYGLFFPFQLQMELTSFKSRETPKP